MFVVGVGKVGFLFLIGVLMLYFKVCWFVRLSFFSLVSLEVIVVILNVNNVWLCCIVFLFVMSKFLIMIFVGM